jgi:hypothetical protein
MGEKVNAYGILVRKPDRKKPVKRPTCRCIDNIKMDFKQDGLIWSELIWLWTRTSGGLL